jgi:hypothetical protein
MVRGERHLAAQQASPGGQKFIIRRSRFRPRQQLESVVRRSGLARRLRGGERASCPAARIDGQHG